MATSGLAPVPVPAGSDIPTYSQVPETTFDRRSYASSTHALLQRSRIMARPRFETPLLTCGSHAVDWADLATLDLSLFDEPGGKKQLAEQLFEAIQNIG